MEEYADADAFCDYAPRQGMSATDEFIPPMPRPARRASGAILSLLRARGDILSAFPQDAYQRQVIPLSLPGRRIFIVNHPDIIRDVFVTKHEIYQRKSRFMEQALEPVIGDSLFINHGAVWEERRAVVAQPLHPSRIGRFHTLFVQAAEEMVEDLARVAPGPVDFSVVYARATARVMLLALFGPRVPREDSAALADAFAAYQQAADNVDIRTILNLPEWMRGRQNRRARARAEELRALIRRNLDAVGDDAPPLLAALREARRADGSPIIAGEALVNEVGMLLLAGSETSANALTWTTYLLAAHPPTLRTMMDEFARLSPGRQPSAEEMGELVVTRAVTQEAMRLYPPVAILSRQALADDDIRHWKLREGHMVIAVPWLLHRNPTWWHRPHAFLPERFLPDAARRQPKFTYIPFGTGPRVCAGAAFASAEMAVFLTILLRRFVPVVPSGWAPVPHCRLTLRARDGMPLMLARR